MALGNPHFMSGLKNRRERLLTILRQNHREDWDQIIAKFALDESLTETTVRGYFELLRKAGMLDE